ncbi:MAG: GAF domain-containing protein [Chthonomonas sp.]|nr:GAF domain-containing protein [Chthonomonas sp.]
MSHTILPILRLARSEQDLQRRLANWLATESGCDSVDLLMWDGQSMLALEASTLTPDLAHRVRLVQTQGVTGAAWVTQEPVWIESGLCQDPRFVVFPGFEESQFRAGFAIPFLEDHYGGVVYLRSYKAKTPDRDRILCLVRDLVEALLGYRQAFSHGAASGNVAAVNQVTSTITASPYLEEILQLLVHLTAKQFDYRVCTVRLLDEVNQELVLRATQATVRAYRRKRAIKLGESIAGRVVKEQHTVIVQDVQHDPDYIGHDLAREQGLHSMICVPLMMHDRAVGVMTCYTAEVREFEPAEIIALETIASQAAVAIEHAKLQVRNTLMQEMHHRVKNNLQQVVSLLRLQIRHKHYKSIEEALNDSLSRILAIASVHDLLSRDDLDHVGIRSIAEALVNHQSQSFILPDKSIQFEVRGQDVRLNMTQATQIALVLNELIQNAVEHGFRETAAGEIHVNIESGEDQIGLWVSNNGDRLPPGFDPQHASNLGLQIVQNLARGLGGTFMMEDRLGWTVGEVTFPRATSE